MSFDGIVTCAAAAELNRHLSGGKIEKIYQPEPEELVFHIHAGGNRRKLLLSSHSRLARVHLTEGSRENPSAPPAFCMLLRKHLQGGRILSVSQKDLDRIVIFSIESVSELGFSVRKSLIAEIMGKHSNIILLDADSGKIIDSIKRISIDVNRYRQILPGKLYQFPPSQDKGAPGALTVSSLALLLAGSFSTEAAARAFSAGIQGISPALAASLAQELGEKLPEGSLSPDAALAAASPEERAAAALPLISELPEAARQNPSPIVYTDPVRGILDFHVTPLLPLEKASDRQTFPTVSQAVDFYYQNKSDSGRTRQKTAELERVAEAGLSRLLLKKQRLSEDLAEAENADRFRLYGELLTASLHLFRTGDTRVSVKNYYDGSQVTIPLDPRISPSRNAQRYFKKYGKSRTAIKEKTARLAETEAEITYLETVLLFLRQVKTAEEADAIRAELTEAGYLRKRRQESPRPKGGLAPFEYRTSGGFRILAGRNNVMNDRLTFRQAGSSDLWFHTKDIPGSHTILFTEGRIPAESDLREAAAAAAFHSRGRLSENVPVDCTRIKYVKKPSGAKPGMVIFTNQRTLYVSPGLPPGESTGPQNP